MKRLRKIYQELVAIRKELQAIRISKEPVSFDVLINKEKINQENHV